MKSLIPKSLLFNLNKKLIVSSGNALIKRLSTVKQSGKNDRVQQPNSASKVHSGENRNEDALFEMFKSEETGLLSIGKFLSALRTTGLRKSDPRLKEMMEAIKRTQKQTDTQRLNLETFRSIVSPCIGLISRAFRHQFIIPEFQDFCKELEDIYWKCKENTNGKVASYIPQLKRMNPNYWGVSVCTIDGQRFSIGDVGIPFTIQSCSKPLTYGIALDLLGEEMVHKYVGQEPSGRNFNELVLDHNKKPHNPMINAGAILVCALLKTVAGPEMTLAEKFDYTLNYFVRLAGGEDLGFNNAVFLSEREAADRNYALGFYMREHKCFPEKTNFKECMDFYFQCCSLEMSSDTLSVMGATLANGGICPLTEEKVLKSESVRDVLSLMHSCGMYDYSGQFAFKVGLPAKSGVSGALLVVIPNVMGISLWSPPLDPLGNSCRGVQFCEELVKKFNFHRYDNLLHSTNKSDPRKHKFETKGMNVVNLLFSAASGDLPGLRRHKLSGMDMTLADYDGRTALHLAAAEGHIHCVNFLLQQCNVQHDIRDRWGRSPLDEALTFGHTAVAEFLQDWDQRYQRSSENMMKAGGTLPGLS
ncbi:glutaminase kidney isoform, mitochondrial isoform X3 [Tribolium castaneum]|uniref:glutaminase n=1 Tax=Tribolium castaneum TaxID=7070 RepID=D6W7V1_TRICA|nr:PREDICTED: glutaminase kidney isoform, mitochondrial isoform X3 [Tribolium castaneum]EFA11037.2 Glutaminase kidney isoform, mitochondrial-like Protein [Tribolium castaneum]|eukprot:XP_008200662.1 PREDICTED: glutaminase kidney isoform, mitochondrial isoform X3 [Tribolium castaneum]